MLGSPLHLWMLALSLGSATEPRKVAVLVGLDGQVNATGDNITSAERGVQELASTLGTAGFETRVLVGEQVDLPAIRDTLESLILTEDDTLVVYIATHGATCPLKDRRRRIQYLRLADTTATSTCWDDALTDEQLFRWADDVGARDVVVGIDACMTRVGVRTAGAVVDLGSARDQYEDFQSLILRSTSPGRPAYEVDGQLLYTTAFREGIATEDADLDCDGAITALEAHDYAASAVLAATRTLDRPAIALRQHTSAGSPRAVVLSGQVGEPACSVFHDLPPSLGWAIGEASEYLGLGPSGSARVPPHSSGPLVLERPVPTADLEAGTLPGSGPPRLRVHGVPSRTPTTVQAGPWMPGRSRGLPATIFWTGVATAPPHAAHLQAGLTLREQLLPELSLGAELSTRADGVATAGFVGGGILRAVLPRHNPAPRVAAVPSAVHHLPGTWQFGLAPTVLEDGNTGLAAQLNVVDW